ncbi:HNH endonuclease signature motif containing protein [Micromonospora rifamycinica]|uniref:HNH endonuclease signature motif containing protein n=1 Tax=Micromonospora rifamycinica TaxID=291594 RepID=UPI0034045F49
MADIMPTRAPRRCTRPGCPGGQACARHRRPRPTRQELGYDEDWLRISAEFLAAHPWCQGCKKRSSKHTDHIDGDTSNREEWNLQALCRRCHGLKTVQHDGGFGRPRTPRPGDDIG